MTKKKRGKQHKVSGNSFLRLAHAIRVRENDPESTIQIICAELEKEGLRVQKIKR